MTRHVAPEEDSRFRGMIAALSPGDRIAAACRMFSTAKALVRAGIISQCGGKEPPDIRKRIGPKCVLNGILTGQRNRLAMRDVY